MEKQTNKKPTKHKQNNKIGRDKIKLHAVVALPQN